MSRFFNRSLDRLVPYTPGEQPQDQQYVKLNTNESPYPPSPGVIAALNRPGGRRTCGSIPDPEAAKSSRRSLAARYSVEPCQRLRGERLG
ncbi:MAG: hypothetical protein ACLT3D_10945 [Lawsonibacter sp.]